MKYEKGIIIEEKVRAILIQYLHERNEWEKGELSNTSKYYMGLNLVI